MTEWLVNEGIQSDAPDFSEQIEREISFNVGGDRESFHQSTPVTLAVRLQDIMIWDTKQWFGEADIRIDALVIQGYAKEGEPGYMPGTFRFPGVKSKDCLLTGENGLLIFYGKALHFLDIYLTVSRDRKNSEDLATLINQPLKSKEIQGAVSTLLGLANVAVPQVSTINSALGAASLLGNLGYKILRGVTGDTIGLYRTCWLQHTDSFGIGRHPKQDSYKVKDFSFWYEIIQES